VLDRFCRAGNVHDLIAATAELTALAEDAKVSVYQRVRALFQAYAICRYHLLRRPELEARGAVALGEVDKLICSRRFREALALLASRPLSAATVSARASAYQGLGNQILAGQVQHSVRALASNQWMFGETVLNRYPLKVRSELLEPASDGQLPVLRERTPVRMDLSHSGWSDIFALGMEYPEGARVLNVSIDLSTADGVDAPAPPIQCYLRVIDRPVVRLCSVDLGVCAELEEVSQVFDYARDHLGLLKAAVVASGIVPPGLEESGAPLRDLLERLLGPRRGLELLSHVRGIPKGSRLGVSTNLLASLITLCMRATGQIARLNGDLDDDERRMIVGRAILGEWLAGSGGGWQDSAGVWPGIKIMEGVVAREGDVEYGSSRGCLLPRHTPLDGVRVPDRAREKLLESLVVVHGGLAANIGPILEIVCEKFLLGSELEWRARKQLLQLHELILESLCSGDIRALAQATTRAFEGPLQSIVPGASNLYTERLIQRVKEEFRDQFWGFWMMGGMSGGGMGFFFDPVVHDRARCALLEIMQHTKRGLERSMFFGREPVVYRVAVNRSGTIASLLAGAEVAWPARYGTVTPPECGRRGACALSAMPSRETKTLAPRQLRDPNREEAGKDLSDGLVPAAPATESAEGLDELLGRLGFDYEEHETLRSALRSGDVGLERNRLPRQTRLEDAKEDDVVQEEELVPSDARVGRTALCRGEVAVVTLAAGSGSRWSEGAGTVKALSPFAKLHGHFRTFIDVHLAKSRRIGQQFGALPIHVLTTGHLTHEAIARELDGYNEDLAGMVRLSPGRSIGLRLVPTLRDLAFLWQQDGRRALEERKSKIRSGAQRALQDWVLRSGECADYRDNVPAQCVHPVGHWYEVANLLLNGTLRALLDERPQLKYLLLHNIDTLGADLDARWLGRHIRSANTLSFEVVRRCFDERGGMLARIGGRARLIEGLALPHEDDQDRLSYYNSLTTWISIDQLLEHFGVTRDQLGDQVAIRRGFRALSTRLPTYITLKEVKQHRETAEETVLVAQFEKLWGDMSALREIKTGFLLVSRNRGLQLKEVSHLDAWHRDGSREYVESLCAFVPCARMVTAARNLA
jgi:hypothetical protein